MAGHNYGGQHKVARLERNIVCPGMYIGKLGDGSSEDDGIYVLLKEVSTIALMNL